jgi:hypothetical protein
MSRFFVGLASVGLDLLSAAPAAANPVGGWRLGIERLLGTAYSWGESRAAGQSTEFSETAFNYAGFGGSNRYSYGSPRVAVDYTFDAGPSLGLAGGFKDTRIELGDTTLESDDALLQGRVGYALAFSDTWGMWPKAGVSFRWIELPGADALFYSSLSLDLCLVQYKNPHVAVAASLHSEIGLSGGSDDVDEKINEVGLSVAFYIAD